VSLYIFDLDGTLISSYMDTRDRRHGAWHVLPGRRERLAGLRAAGHTVAVATNQAGVAFGYVSESQARRKIAAVLEALGLPADTPVAVCFAHPHARSYRYRSPAELARRKPSGAMLREVMERVGAQERVQFVGDSPEDRQAARDAGVSFTWATDFIANDDDAGIVDDDSAGDD
jgi:D-glycero-D-manno-heptose 1,7-bisphosphate phosphatase